MWLDRLLAWPISWPLAPVPQAVLAALATALLLSGGLRLAGRRDLAPLGVGAGLALGWWLILGGPTASPRQLPERLPGLALAGVVAGLLLAQFGRGGGRGGGWVGRAGAALLVLTAAWWLAGAPLAPADLRRAAVPLLALAVLGAAAVELRTPLRAVVAFGLALAGIWLAAPIGPWSMLAMAAFAAALGGLVAGQREGQGVGTPPGGVAAWLPMALGLAGLVAGPLLARGAAADWNAAAAPFAALWLGPVLAARIGGPAGGPLGWGLAGGVPLLFAWLLGRGG
jgi:hypothetical protein